MDEKNISYEAESSQVLQKLVSKELQTVNVWLDVNKLSLNMEKPNFIAFRTSRHSFKAIATKYGRKNKYVKLLRMLSDDHLNWKNHSLELSKKTS